MGKVVGGFARGEAQIFGAQLGELVVGAQPLHVLTQVVEQVRAEKIETEN